jgi:hypothetical protein
LSGLFDALAGMGADAVGLVGSAAASLRQQQRQGRRSGCYLPASGPLRPGGSQQRQSLVLTMKIAGVHWWYRHSSHASELTAGYYNTDTRDGYQPILELCARYNLNLTLTCVEMCDSQHPQHAHCGPEGLLRQIRAHAALLRVSLSGENALPIFQLGGVDTMAMDRIVANTRACANTGMRSCTSWPGTGPSQGHLLGNIVSTGRTFSEVGRRLHPLGEGSYCSLSTSASGGSLAGTASVQTGWGGGSGLYSGLGEGVLGSGGGCGYADGDNGSPVMRVNSGRGDYSSRLLLHEQQQHQQHSHSEHHNHPSMLPPMRSFTFLRLGPEILHHDYQVPWMHFMYKMLNEQG